jgi:demethylmenaquinone methyltransferase/2-methoxy-6-polyprenyl-1,4-benzoquinol methylase
MEAFVISLHMVKKQVIPYGNKKSSKKKQVKQMFDGISKRYDLTNRLITGGMDLQWRKKVIRLLTADQPKKILDMATGTGDLAMALAKTEATEIVGIDLSPGMLEIGKERIKKQQLSHKIKMEVGDSEKIAYPDHYFDAATIGFGVRNFENLDRGLSEIWRVLRPGGKLVILETAVPQKFPMNRLYPFYTQKIVPLLGWIFSNDWAAYRYLSNSAAHFPFGQAFNNILVKNGFIKVEDLPQTLGVASIYCAKKPD